MEIIYHRRNLISDLKSTPRKFGVEVDIRSFGKDLIVHHDPFVSGELFVDWLQNFAHGTLILNVKEEGLEDRLLELMYNRKIENFFFLDQSFPFLMKTISAGEKRCAIRVSEYESMYTAINLSERVKWVWLDCFTKFPLSKIDIQKLQSVGYKICLVSPELQGRFKNVERFREQIETMGIKIDAVCTKLAEIWQ